jgi:hypothetical protein
MTIIRIDLVDFGSRERLRTGLTCILQEVCLGLSYE